MAWSAWFTQGTIWVALGLYLAGELAAGIVTAPKRRRLARGFSTGGWTALLAHMLCAFHFHHGWSHDAAYAETARQTAVLVGWDWGGGLYFNYAFALVWLMEVGWLWADLEGYHQRPPWATAAVRAFLFFMILNGAVVFVHGIRRWAGALVCLGLAWAWWRRPTRGVSPTD